MITAAVRVLDIESTGLDPAAGARICELGWCDVLATANDDKGEPYKWVVEKYWHSLLVNPCVPMPPEAQAAHHITDAELANAPTIEEAIKEIYPHRNLQIGDFDSIAAYAAHHAKFDRQFIEPHFAAPWICTMRCWQHVAPDAPGFSNQVLRYHLKPRGLDAAKAMPPHRAGPDAYVTAHLLRDLLNRTKPNGERNTVERLVKATANVPILKFCMLGKQRGKLYEEVDSGFLHWLLDPSRVDGFSEEDVATARHWLNERGKA